MARMEGINSRFLIELYNSAFNSVFSVEGEEGEEAAVTEGFDYGGLDRGVFTFRFHYMFPFAALFT